MPSHLGEVASLVSVLPCSDARTVNFCKSNFCSRIGIVMPTVLQCKIDFQDILIIFYYPLTSSLTVVNIEVLISN